MTTPEREKFEDWYCREHWDFRKGARCRYFASEDAYTLMDIQLAYRSWQAALSAAPQVPGDWQLVPVEPTDAMIYMMYRAFGNIEEKRDSYQEMLSAAPTAPVMDKRTGLSAMILRSVCEAERANPDDDQNICISVDHLQIILDNQIAEFIPTPPEVDIHGCTSNAVVSQNVENMSNKQVEPVGFIDRRGNFWSVDRAEAEYSDGNILELKAVYTSPPFPNADEVTRRDELLFENAQLRGQLLKYEDPDKYMALGSVLSGTITKEQCEEWLKTRGSPKAEYDAEGNPLNLRAAAKRLCDQMDAWSFDTGGSMEHIWESKDNLRKFIGEKS